MTILNILFHIPIFMVMVMVLINLSPAKGTLNINTYSSWGYQSGTLGFEQGRGIALDDFGNIFVAGATGGSLYAVQGAVGEIDSRDFFIAKIDGASGALHWGYQNGTTGRDLANAVTVDSLGYVIIGGITTGSLYITNYGEYDYFVLKLNGSSGDKIWGIQHGSTGTDNLYAISVDHENNIFASGCTTGNLYNSNIGDCDLFLVKLDGQTGIVIWEFQIGTEGFDSAVGLAVDLKTGDVFITGYTKGSLYAQNAGDNDFFVAKFDGRIASTLWSYQYGKLTSDDGHSIAIDSVGNAVIVGDTSGALFGENAGDWDFFSVKFNGSTGEVMWGAQYGSSLYDCAYAVAIDKISDDPIIAGYTDGTEFGGSYGLQDYYATKIDGVTGSITTGLKFGSNQNDIVYSVVIDNIGSVFVGGYTEGDLYSSNAGNSDYFVAKFGCIQGTYIGINFTCTPCVESTFSLGNIMPDCYNCPAGTSSESGSSACYDCAAGTYSNHPGSSCKQCPGILTSPEASTNCPYIHIPSSSTTEIIAVTVAGVVLIFVIMSIKLPVGYIAESVVASADFISDIIYITSTTFYSPAVFSLACIFMILSFSDFASEIHADYKNRLRENQSFSLFNEFRQLYPYPTCLFPEWRVVSFKNYYPYIGSKRLFPSQIRDMGNILYFLLYVVCIFIAFLLLVPWLILDFIWFAPWSLVHIPYYFCILLPGYILYQCKLLQHAQVSRLFDWLLWNNTIDSNIDAAKNTIRRLNRSTLSHVLLESCPQLVIQPINQRLLNQSPPIIFYVSVCMSVLMISCSLYRIFYWHIWRGEKLENIPPLLSFSIKARDIFNSSDGISLTEVVASDLSFSEKEINTLIAVKLQELESLMERTDESLMNLSRIAHFPSYIDNHVYNYKLESESLLNSLRSKYDYLCAVEENKGISAT